MADHIQTVGSSPIRKEGTAKVLGRAKYVDDLSLPDMWFGATVRSTIPRGRIKSINFSPNIPWHEFTIVTAADIPGENVIIHLSKDHPCLAATHINHPNEPILLLAHPDRAVLPAAVAAVHITYEELPAVFTIDESEAPGAPVIWSDPASTAEPNTFKTYLMRCGNEADLDHIFATADYIVEGEYRTGAQEQLYIENNGVIAEYSATEGVTVRGSLQCPFYLSHALELVFNLPPEKCRVIQTETGGAFGGKEDFPSVIGSHAALLAMKSGHPVKLCYDRAEDLAGTTKRHPSRSRHRTAVSKDGKILGGTIDFALDGGAYVTLSTTVLSRGTIHAAGPYHWPALRVRGKAMATNLPPHGAFRGFGAPQSIFGTERHMDRIAHTIGLSPEDFRRRNLIAPGGRTATGQLIPSSGPDSVDMQQLLTRALEASDYHAKRARFKEENPTSPIKHGIGFATFFHGSGFTGSGERRLNSLVEIEITPEGQPRILVSSTEFGQGTNTILCQVAAQALNLPYDFILIAQPDTTLVPNSGPTVASRTAMIVGKLVERAAQSLCATLVTSGHLPHEYSAADFRNASLAYVAQHGPLKSSVRYQSPGDIFWDDDNYKGEAYPAYAWAVYVAEVAVDTTTYSATCTNFHALQEVGKVLHPVLAAGQIEGGVAQGIGYALYEKCVWQRGHMANNQMTNYIMPTSADIPPIHVLFEEIPSIHGPFGAKGIGELPMDGPAPAILNAIQDATGVSLTEIPLLPEDIFEKLTANGHTDGGTEDLNPAIAGPYFTEATA
jgi:CO/xanthine dehydrogenase Mo-binding subunit